MDNRPSWIIPMIAGGYAIDVQETPDWFMDYLLYNKYDLIRKRSIQFAKWLDGTNKISVTPGGNGIIHNIEKLYEMYLESLK